MPPRQVARLELTLDSQRHAVLRRTLAGSGRKIQRTLTAALQSLSVEDAAERATAQLVAVDGMLLDRLMGTDARLADAEAVQVPLRGVLSETKAPIARDARPAGTGRERSVMERRSRPGLILGAWLGQTRTDPPDHLNGGAAAWGPGLLALLDAFDTEPANALAKGARMVADRYEVPLSPGDLLGHAPDSGVAGSAEPPCGWLIMDAAANQVAGQALVGKEGQLVSDLTVDGVLP